MKVFLCIGDLDKDKLRGTEYYVIGLCNKLMRKGIETYIVCPANKKYPNNHTYQGINILRFGKPDLKLSKKQLQSKIPPDNLSDFIHLCRSINPDIIHFHSLTTALGIFHAKRAQKDGFKLIFTSHVPHNICPIGVYIRDKKQCNNKIGPHCQYCIIKQNINTPIANLLGKSYLKYFAGLLPGKFQLPKILQRRLKSIGTTFDFIVSPSKWQISAFTRNSINTSKLAYIPQGILEKKQLSNIKIHRYKENDKLIIGYLGAIHPIKGIELLLSTFNQIKRNDLFLEIVGNTSHEFAKKLEKNYKSNRISFLGEKKGDNLYQWLNSIDTLIIPSVCSDMAPLNLMEAFTFKIPVIGSNLGGIPEVVTSGVNGKLFNPFNPNELKTILSQLDKKEIENIKLKMPKFNRTFNDVISDNLDLYNKLS